MADRVFAVHAARACCGAVALHPEPVLAVRLAVGEDVPELPDVPLADVTCPACGRVGRAEAAALVEGDELLEVIPLDDLAPGGAYDLLGRAPWPLPDPGAQ